MKRILGIMLTVLIMLSSCSYARPATLSELNSMMRTYNSRVVIGALPIRPLKPEEEWLKANGKDRLLGSWNACPVLYKIQEAFPEYARKDDGQYIYETCTIALDAEITQQVALTHDGYTPLKTKNIILYYYWDEDVTKRAFCRIKSYIPAAPRAGILQQTDYEWYNYKDISEKQNVSFEERTFRSLAEQMFLRYYHEPFFNPNWCYKYNSPTFEEDMAELGYTIDPDVLITYE